MSDTELEQLADQAGYGEHGSDQRLLATRAVLEKVRRTQAAETAARVAAPGIAARESARFVYESMGLPGEGFERWYQERQQQEAGRKLDDQRVVSQMQAKRAF